MSAYYNELEPYAADWIRNLVAAGHVADGRVDARSIREVQPADLDGSTQAHFFAGVGVWSYALRLAGWPDSLPVWTGSCPCQPWSVAGKQAGADDDRHLWPEWFRLIRECRPPVVFGEQVARGGGLEWFDLVSDDLEAEGYAVGAANLAAPCAGAFHIRERLFFVAYADGERRDGEYALLRAEEGGEGARAVSEVAGRGAAGRVAITNGIACDEGSPQREGRDHGGDALPRTGPGSGGGTGFWSDAEWIRCLDGKSRPVEPGTFPLAHGAPSRVGRLRAYGNAIVPQVAATFIRAAMSAIVAPPDGARGSKP